MAGRNTTEEVIRLIAQTSGDKEITALASKLGELAKGSDGAAEQAQQLVAELKKLAETSKNIKQFTGLKAAIADTGDQLEKAKTKMASLGAELDRTQQPTKRLQTSLQKAANEVENLTKQQNKQQAELGRTTNSLRAAGVDTDKLAHAYDDLQGEFASFTHRAGESADALEKTGKGTKKAAKGVSTLDKAAKSSGKSLAAIAKQLTIVSGAATVAIQGLAALTGATLFTGAIRSATTLEEALSQVRAVSGATAAEMVKLKDAAEQGGASTKFSSLEAAQGLGELARATGSAEAAIAALPATLNLAQAAGVGVAESATFISTAIAQFGLNFSEAGRVADVFAKEANATTDDVTGLANALSYAAPSAKQLGLSIEDTAAIVGTLADQGFRGERAGTALRNTFDEMLNPASDFAGALREMGIESTDFFEIIEQLAGSSDKGREALQKLGDRARPAIQSLVDTGGKGLRSLRKDIDEAGGSAAETAAIMGNNLSGAAESIKDSFDRTRRSLVEPLLGPLSDELFKLSKQLEDFAKTPEFEQIKEVLKDLFVEGAEAATDLIEKTDFIALAGKIRDFVTQAKSSLGEFKENIDVVINAVSIFGNTLELIFNSVQAVILGVASIVARNVSYLASTIDALSAPARKVLEFLGVLDEGQYSLKQFAGGMGAVADDFQNRFTKNVGEAVDNVQELAGVAEDTGTTTTAALDGISDASEKAAASSEGLADAADSAKAGLEGQAQGAAEAAAATDAAAGKMDVAGERIKKAFADLGIESQSNLQRAAEAAKRNFELITRAVQDGEASAEDARRAFMAYAAAARAAVADSDLIAKQRVEAELTVKAAILDTTGTLHLMGAAGASAGDAVAAGATRASGALSSLSSSASSASRDVASAGDAVASAGDKSRGSAAGVEKMSFAFVQMSESATKALFAQNKFAAFQDIWLKNVNAITGEWRRQNTALQEVNAQLDDQLAKYDPLTEKVKALQQQYGYVDEASLRTLAEKQQRLEQEQTRVDDERKRALQEVEKAKQQAAPANNAPATPATASSAAASASRSAPVSSGGVLATLRLILDGNTHDVLVRPDSVAGLLQDISRAKSVSIRGSR